MLSAYRRRYRTGTAELAPFWRAMSLYRHDPRDENLYLAEWATLGLDVGVVCALTGAGLSCYRVVPPCPDWLLATIPGLGPARIEVIRRLLPSSHAIYDGPLCPGRVIENARSVENPDLDAYLREQARRETTDEPELLGTPAVLSAFRPRPGP